MAFSKKRIILTLLIFLIGWLGFVFLSKSDYTYKSNEINEVKNKNEAFNNCQLCKGKGYTKCDVHGNDKDVKKENCYKCNGTNEIRCLICDEKIKNPKSDAFKKEKDAD